KIILGVGVFRALEAITFRWMYPSIDLLPHATTHHDSVLFRTCVAILSSVLFTTCVAILGALLLEVPRKRTLGLVLILGPIFLWAIQANARRLVWAELGLVAFAFWLITPWTRLKKRVARLTLKAAVPLLLYGAVGWGSESVVFAPVKKIRSLTDSEVNTST